MSQGSAYYLPIPYAYFFGRPLRVWIAGVSIKKAEMCKSFLDGI